MTKVSILGLGAMGSALAHCLIKNGHVVSVWNRSPEKAAPLVQAGATACETVDDAVAASDLILTCIRGHRDVVGLISGVETPVPLMWSGGDVYRAEIPGQSGGTSITTSP